MKFSNFINKNYDVCALVAKIIFETNKNKNRTQNRIESSHVNNCMPCII